MPDGSLKFISEEDLYVYVANYDVEASIKGEG
jgi:hypothetical protein